MNETPPSRPSTERLGWLGIVASYTLALATWVAVVLVVFRDLRP